MPIGKYDKNTNNLIKALHDDIEKITFWKGLSKNILYMYDNLLPKNIKSLQLFDNDKFSFSQSNITEYIKTLYDIHKIIYDTLPLPITDEILPEIGYFDINIGNLISELYINVVF